MSEYNYSQLIPQVGQNDYPDKISSFINEVSSSLTIESNRIDDHATRLDLLEAFQETGVFTAASINVVNNEIFGGNLSITTIEDGDDTGTLINSYDSNFLILRTEGVLNSIVDVRMQPALFDISNISETRVQRLVSRVVDNYNITLGSLNDDQPMEINFEDSLGRSIGNIAYNPNSSHLILESKFPTTQTNKVSIRLDVVDSEIKLNSDTVTISGNLTVSGTINGV